MGQDKKAELGQRMSFYELAAHKKEYASIYKTLEAHADAALDLFYDKLSATPEVSHFFSSGQMIDRAHQAQKNHWLRLFGEGLDQEYLDRAVHIGDTHARIGLEPQWYIGGYALILEQVIEQMIAGGARKAIPGQSKLARTVSSLVKVALLDMDLALSTYFVKAEENVRTMVVSKIGSALEDISNGDLTSRIDDLPESYAKLQSDFNAAMEKLRGIIEAVTDGSRSITAGAGEIRTASDDLSRRTEQQAARLEESAGAMSRLSDAVSDTSQSISGLNTSVTMTHKEALQGGEVVRNAVKAMDDIQKSSDSIAQIIKIIDGIAFQTNLLALNAGVEAARVGELGKGFAVVANEVRALAQRSSEAAEEIKHLIGESLGQVESGVRLVNDTGKVLDVIVNQMGEISEVATQISESTAVQSKDLQQINHAVADMDQVTQQNAAMVEEATAAARAMAAEAERLSGMVAQFKVMTGQRASVKAVAPVKTAKPAPVRTAGNLAIATQEDDWSDF